MAVKTTKPYVNTALDFIEDLAEACKKRSRAVSRRGAKLKCMHVQEIENGQQSSLKRLDVDIDYRVNGAPIRIRVHGWSDRWVWLDARRASKDGWIWEATMEGRFVDKRGARGLVENLERTMDATWGASDAVAPRIIAIWSPYIATGPKRV